jgi:hypothetical protein
MKPNPSLTFGELRKNADKKSAAATMFDMIRQRIK